MHMVKSAHPVDRGAVETIEDLTSILFVKDYAEQAAVDGQSAVVVID
jgi:hypothetical protein